MYQLYFRFRNHRCLRAMPCTKKKLLAHVWVWLLQRCGTSSSAHLTLNGDHLGSQRDASKVLGLLVATHREAKMVISQSNLTHLLEKTKHLSPSCFCEDALFFQEYILRKNFAAILKEIDDDDKDNLMWCIILKFRCKYFWSQFPILPQLSFGTDGKI